MADLLFDVCILIYTGVLAKVNLPGYVRYQAFRVLKSLYLRELYALRRLSGLGGCLLEGVNPGASWWSWRAF